MLNIMHVRYAVEIAKTGTINKAAENLMVAQPNLSRAIKDLEEYLGITIFNRTKKGMDLTQEGEKFILDAEKVLSEIEEVENIYKYGDAQKKVFSISVPRANYLSDAFTKFTNCLSEYDQCDIEYRETDNQGAIRTILNGNFRLGIVRYETQYNRYYKSILDEKGLKVEYLSTFRHVVMVGKNNPLAKKVEVHFEDLADKTVIIHGAPFMPALSTLQSTLSSEVPLKTDKQLVVYDRASQMEILNDNMDTFMWSDPMSPRMAEKLGLVQINCPDNKKEYQDVLIFRKNYQLTELDKEFISILTQVRDDYVTNINREMEGPPLPKTTYGKRLI